MQNYINSAFAKNQNFPIEKKFGSKSFFENN